MDNPTTRRPERGDDENTSFGVPSRAFDRRAGTSQTSSDQQDDWSNYRRKPGNAAEIPQETLAARITQARQEGGNS
jgi:hypothetical protein